MRDWTSGTKITCKPSQNFVKCSHLKLLSFLCPQNCSALFVGRASSFIICRFLLFCLFASVSRYKTNTSKQARNQGAKAPRKFYSPPGKLHWTWFKTIGHGSINLRPSQKTLRPSWCPKLVAGLLKSPGSRA